jgi:hypothetical protein
MILSSRFGFLYPDTLITNYNTTFLDHSTGAIDVEQLRVSAQQVGATAYQEIEILGGNEYVSRLHAALRDYPITILAPYANCDGIETMMGLAKAAITAGIPIDSPSTHVKSTPSRERGMGPTTKCFRPRGRPSEASNPAFIRRAIDFHQRQGMAQGIALAKAAEEFDITLPPSYQRYPGMQFLRWRKQGYGPTTEH